MRHRLRAVAALLVLCCALGGSQGAADPKNLKARVPADKATAAPLPPDTPLAQVVVKFHEGTRVRLRGNALTVLERGGRDQRELEARGLDDVRVADDLAAFRRLIAQTPKVKGLQRLFQQDEATLAERRGRGEERSGRELADLDLYYQLRLPAGTTAEEVEELVDAINALDSVEIAYASPVSAPASLQMQGTSAPLIQPCTSASYQSLQGYLSPAPTGVDAFYAWTQPNGRGTGVKIVDVEGGWRLTHEDVPFVFYQGGTQNPSWVNHGTAVIGEMVGVDNGCGVTGISNQAQLGVQSFFDANMVGNAASAISTAATQAGAGGIVLIELHTRGPVNSSPCTCNTTQCDYIAEEYFQANFDAIATATANGTIVVEAAGNGSSDLDDPAYGNRFNRSFRDSGAILVAASHSSGRTPTCWTNWGSRIDVHGWGENVVTTGYGDLPGGVTNQDYWYTDGFSGTSSASPIVTGSAASLQATAIARGLGALPPTVMRRLLKDTGTPQVPDPKNIGPLPDLKAAHQRLAANQPPVASFTYTCAQLDCSFNGGGSTDDFGIVSYAWSFGDSTSGSGATVNHTYGARGVYTVTLTVTDTLGRTHAQTQTVSATKRAQVVMQTVPTTMAAGRVYPVSVKLKNIGSYAWDPVGAACNAYRWASMNNHWSTVRAELPGLVAPGQEVTLNFNVIAPATAGTYAFQWQMVQECVEHFGDAAPSVSVTVTAASARDAQVLGQNVPSTMVVGTSQAVSITLRNVGSMAWNPVGAQCNAFRLGSLGTSFQPVRAELSSAVASGSNVTLTFNVIAPATPGSYDFQWQMVQECVQWFGDLTPKVTVNVVPPANDAEIVSQSVPTTMTAGQTYSATVTVKNVGTNNWSTIGNQCNAYRLGKVNNANLGPFRVDLTASLASGQQTILTFNVTAPSTPGTYDFQWQMVQECVQWFGDLSPKVTVTVN